MLTHLANQVISTMGTVPELVVYAIVALWIGVDSAGIPLPMEPVLLFTGTLAVVGRATLILAVLSATLGALLFASVAYSIGRRVGAARVVRAGHRIGLTDARATHIESWVRQHGFGGEIFAALCPVLRTFSSYFMGIVGVPRATFTLAILIASALYCTLWLALGSALGANYRVLLGAFDSIGLVGLAIAIAIAIGVALAHHFWGRYSLRHVEAHFHRRQQVAAVPERHAPAL